MLVLDDVLYKSPDVPYEFNRINARKNILRIGKFLERIGYEKTENQENGESLLVKLRKNETEIQLTFAEGYDPRTMKIKYVAIIRQTQGEDLHDLALTTPNYKKTLPSRLHRMLFRGSLGR